MNITLGFVAVLLLILFPGLIFRRLYYSGEFSRQFKPKQNIINLLTISTIPGLFIFVIIFVVYDLFFHTVDLQSVINEFKEVGDTVKSVELKLSKDNIYKYILPFLGFLYLASSILGFSFGYLIRKFKLDTRFKLLRFKNYWFYFFTGEINRIKKYNKHTTNDKGKKLLFKKADILIETATDNILYSGFVIDYELDNDDCQILSKIILKDAKRYKLKDIDGKKKRVAVNIPGDFFIVDCTNMKSVNLTYIYTEKEKSSILKTKVPFVTQVVYVIISILLIPLFIYKLDNIDNAYYNLYFGLSWYVKILVYLLVIQVLDLFNPFIKYKNEYKVFYKDISLLFIKLSVTGILALLVYWLS